MGDVPCQPRCISHTVFGLAWIDVLTCARCGANADPIPSHSLIYQIYAQDLLAWPVSTFSALLAMLSDSRSFACPEAEAATACAGKAKLRRHFLPPIGDTLAVSLVWPPEPESTYIEAVLARLGTEINTSEAFHIHNATPPRVGTSSDAADEAVYALRGMIVYYGRHCTSVVGFELLTFAKVI
jgi:hypothetical protein